VDLQFLYRLEDELTRARYDIDEKYQMGIGELREALKDIPGLDSVTISYQEAGGLQTYTIGGRRITVSRFAPISEVVEKYLNKRNEMANPFDDGHEEKHMSITGLKSGAFHGTIEALRQRLIDKQNQGAAKIAAAGEMGAAKIDEAVNNAESKIDKEVSEVLQDFSEFTNGGPV
jgi:hypothetical protein